MAIGDEERLAFCRRVYPQLVGAVGLYCGRVDLAEEIAQEALAKACLRWSQVQQLEHPVAWVHKVALNMARSWFRRRAAERRAHARLELPVEYHDPDPSTTVALREAVRERLTPRQREAVVLRFYADLPIAETAQVMGCAPGTVQALTAKALRALREELTEPVQNGGQL